MAARPVRRGRRPDHDDVGALVHDLELVTGDQLDDEHHRAGDDVDHLGGPGGGGSSTSTTATTLVDAIDPPAPPQDPVVESFATDEDRALFEALDGGGDARAGHYDGQPVFDPLLANAVLDAELAAARLRQAQAVQGQEQALAARAAASAHLADLDVQLGGLDGMQRAGIEHAARAEGRLRSRLVDAYVRHGTSEGPTLGAASAGQAALRTGLVQAVAQADLDAVTQLDAAMAGLEGGEAELASQLADARRDAAGAEQAVTAADWVRLVAESDVTVLATGSHVAVAGFVFPVAGSVSFVDSFGAPRNSGTSWAHWHEGTDVMADAGTPLVAVETGVIRKAGVNHLGGNAISLVGASGHLYYYAHMAGFAPGIATGVEVRAGQLLGTVGDTGDARGGAPHVHFEITPPGTDEEVNPYHLLSVAWQARVDALAAIGRSPAEPVAAGLTGVVSG